jgi:hypothetical protein
MPRLSENAAWLTDDSHCRPGGYFEVHDLATRIKSDHIPIPEDSQVDKWCQLMREGIVIMHRKLDLDGERLADLMREVGFTEVVLRPFKIPVGSWPADAQLKTAGQLQQVAMLEGIEALTLAIFTRCLNWSADEVSEEENIHVLAMVCHCYPFLTSF